MEYQFRSHNLTGHRIGLRCNAGCEKECGQVWTAKKGESVLNKLLHVARLCFIQRIWRQTVAVASHLKDLK